MLQPRVLSHAAILLFVLAGSAHAQWPALYFRADPFLRLDLSRPEGGSEFEVGVFSYSAESYFDGRDQTPHSSKAEAANVRFQREEYIFSGQIGLSNRTAIIGALPVSHVKQRLFESGEWGIEKAWVGITHALDQSHHISLVLVGAVPIDGSIGELHFPVRARDNSGFVTTQLILSRESTNRIPSVYLRAGVGVYTSKEEYYGRRLYEFPGELRATIRLADALRAGFGSEGRFVVGSPDNHLFSHTLYSHDAFAFGPDLILNLAPDTKLHATYRHEVFGFFATAGSYWNVAVVLNGSHSGSR
jgi:hypothetical protein